MLVGLLFICRLVELDFPVAGVVQSFEEVLQAGMLLYTQLPQVEGDVLENELLGDADVQLLGFVEFIPKVGEIGLLLVVFLGQQILRGGAQVPGKLGGGGILEIRRAQPHPDRDSLPLWRLPVQGTWNQGGEPAFQRNRDRLAEDGQYADLVTFGALHDEPVHGKGLRFVHAKQPLLCAETVNPVVHLPRDLPANPVDGVRAPKLFGQGEHPRIVAKQGEKGADEFVWDDLFPFLKIGPQDTDRGLDLGLQVPSLRKSVMPEFPWPIGMGDDVGQDALLLLVEQMAVSHAFRFGAQYPGWSPAPFAIEQRQSGKVRGWGVAPDQGIQVAVEDLQNSLSFVCPNLFMLSAQPVEYADDCFRSDRSEQFREEELPAEPFPILGQGSLEQSPTGQCEPAANVHHAVQLFPVVG